MLSSYNNNLNFCNGWDRWWLGWKNPDHTYYISARDTDSNEVDADLTYGQPLENNEFILRDFATLGDAIRIHHHRQNPQHRQPPHGNVVILPGANLILDSEGATLLAPGVEVLPGATLEVR